MGPSRATTKAGRRRIVYAENFIMGKIKEREKKKGGGGRERMRLKL